MSDFKNPLSDFNPFDFDNFTIGVGWDGKTVTITQSKFIVDYFGTDENPWIDPNTGERGFSNVWAVSGVTEDSEYERTEKYSIGKALIPSDDGESFAHRDGKPNATFNQRSGAAVFAKALKESGFDLGRLVSEDGTPKASGLVGAMFVFRGEQVIDKNGNPKVSNGYEVYRFHPVEFVGMGSGATAKAEVSNELRNRAYDLITDLLTNADGQKLTRVQLIQALNKALKGDKDLNDIVKLAVTSEFNSTAPWKFEGTTISLAA